METRVELYKQFTIRPLSSFLNFLDNGELDRETIEGMLNNIFKGQEFEYGDTSVWHCAMRIKLLLQQSKKYSYLVPNLSYKKETSQTYNLTYKGHTLLTVMVRKEQGKLHHNWYHSYHDYSIKEVKVDCWANSIDERINQIEEEVRKEELRQNAELQRAYNAYKAILSSNPELKPDSYTIRSIVDYISHHLGTLGDMYKQEVKTNA